MGWVPLIKTRTDSSQGASAAPRTAAPGIGNQARLRLSASRMMLQRAPGDEEEDAPEEIAADGGDAEALGAAPQPGDEAPDIEGPGPKKKKTKRAEIAFKKNGEGTIEFGSHTYKCLGSPSVKYTKDLTVQGKIDVDKFRRTYSKEYDVMLDWAILIMGQRGIYIHEMPDNLKENGGPSAGCIHLGPGHAQTFYNWVNGPTRITISYPW